MSAPLLGPRRRLPRIVVAAFVGLISIGMPGASTSAGRAVERSGIGNAARLAAPGDVTFRPCSAWLGRARCGRVRVLVDERDPSLGTMTVGFASYRRRQHELPSRGTIVAVEGGPGYGTIASRYWYLRLFRPLMERRDLLLMDLRGTGRSGAIDCPDLQGWDPANHTVPWAVAEQRCGEQLGPLAERYGSAFGADDLATLLGALGVDGIDLYGDSYGTFFAQTFAVRHPDLVDTLTLDAAYPITGADAWWRDTNRAALTALRRSCRRDAACDARPIEVLRRVVGKLRQEPMVGPTFDADGNPRKVRLTPQAIGAILASSGYASPIDRELVAAARAALRAEPDPAPLLRIAAENGWYGDFGNVRLYSQGLAAATTCNDYPMLWNRKASFRTRAKQFRHAVAELRRDDPTAFDPLRVGEWANAPDAAYRSCLRWPAPEDRLPPFPPGGSFPDVPTLVLDGEFDSVTSPAGSRRVARDFPNATSVEVPNAYHVTGLDGPGTCVSRIILRFVRSSDPGDTSCIRRHPPIRVVGSFPRRSTAIGGSVTRRAALVATNTVGDVMARWSSMLGYDGVGLRGGTFETTGYDAPRWRLHGVRWVADVPVDGVVRTDGRTGKSSATVTLAGDGIPWSHLTVRWNVRRPRERAVVTGTVGGARIRVEVPIP